MCFTVNSNQNFNSQILDVLYTVQSNTLCIVIQNLFPSVCQIRQVLLYKVILIFVWIILLVYNTFKIISKISQVQGFYKKTMHFHLENKFILSNCCWIDHLLNEFYFQSKVLCTSFLQNIDIFQISFKMQFNTIFCTFWGRFLECSRHINYGYQYKILWIYPQFRISFVRLQFWPYCGI